MASLFLPYSNVRIFTSGATFTVPSDWNPRSNLIAALGSGANATNPGLNGAGGGGGAFAWSVNLSSLVFGTSFTITVGVPASPNSSFGSLVIAAGASATNGGLASASTGQNKFSGGNGSTVPNGPPTTVFGAGGGAAGPNGAGSNASAGTAGAADGGTVLAPFGNGASGLSGTEFDTAHGCGSGGNGAVLPNPGGKGGNYGGGAGFGNAPFSVGGQGLVIVAYNPLSPAALFLGM